MAPNEQPRSLDSLVEFHEQLLKLHEVGLPMQVDDQSKAGDLSSRLDGLLASIAFQMSRNRTLNEVLADRAIVPVRYAIAFETWMDGGRTPAAFPILIDPAIRSMESRTEASHTLIQPLVISILFYLGVLFLMWRVAPILRNILEQSHLEAGPFLSLLLFLHQSMVIWGPALPILLVVGIAMWRRSSKRWRLDWMPGGRSVRNAVESAAYADGLAACALTLGQLPDLEQTTGAASYLHVEAGSPKESGRTSRLPPMLRWATARTMDPKTQAELLNHTAQAYRHKAELETSRWRRLLPLVIGTGLGGIIVLAYGMMLLGPVIELLLSISAPKS